MEEGHRVRAVPAGRWLRILDPRADDGPPESLACRRRSEPVPGWRPRAGVRQLPASELLCLEEGFHRAFVLADLDICAPPPAPEGTLLRAEEAWLECSRRDRNFPFRLAAYQHFSRSGWRLASGLKYGATYLLYASTDEAPGAIDHGHAPFAVYLVPPKEPLVGSAGCHGTKRKRGEGQVEHTNRGQGDKDDAEVLAQDATDTSWCGAAANGSEATLEWRAIQGTIRLASHVSKKVHATHACVPACICSHACARARAHARTHAHTHTHTQHTHAHTHSASGALDKQRTAR